MKAPEGLLYHPEHTWAKVDGDEALVGITDFAQDELGDVVYIELPEAGARVAVGEVFGTIESSKSVSELFSPVSGDITEVNTSLEDSPEKVNDDPYGEGWIIRVKLDSEPDRGVLTDAGKYLAATEAE